MKFIPRLALALKSDGEFTSAPKGQEMNWPVLIYKGGFLDSSDGQESACNAEDPGSIPGSGRSAGEGIGYPLQYSWASLVAQQVKKFASNVGDPGLILGLGKSSGEGKGSPLQYSGLENSMDCIVHGVTNIRTRLSDFHFTIYKGAYGTLYEWLEGLWFCMLCTGICILALRIKPLQSGCSVPGTLRDRHLPFLV